MRKRAFVFSGLVLGLVLASFLLFHSLNTSSGRTAFHQIQIGMTRQEVQRIMEKTPHQGSGRLGCLDTWDFEDRSYMWVIFQPDYYLEVATVDQQNPESENWKVCNVSLMGGGMTIRGLLKRFGLWSGSLEISKP
jgi:hypothetical protein